MSGVLQDVTELEQLLRRVVREVVREELDRRDRGAAEPDAGDDAELLELAREKAATMRRARGGR